MERSIAAGVFFVGLLAACAPSSTSSPAPPPPVLVDAGAAELAEAGAPHVSGADAADRVSLDYCVTLRICFRAAFDARYAQGIDGCARDVVSRAIARDAGGACTPAQVEACVRDTDSMACAPSLDAMALPSSCDGC